MKHVFLIFLTIALCNYSFQGKEIKTKKYAGVYSYSYGDKKGNAQITIYPETDNTILFYIYIDGGGSSGHEGQFYGRLKVDYGIGSHFIKFEHSSIGCKWDFVFKQNYLTIKTDENKNDCGCFGYGIKADGLYNIEKGKDYTFFIDEFHTKNYFNKISPQEWNK